MDISIIVAVSENGVIGKDNQLLWNLPADLKFFKDKTSGHVVIMGRKTHESIGKALPNRTNIIITRNNDYKADGCLVVSSLSAAIEKARETGEKETFVIGGAEIYKQSMEQIDRIYLTEIKTVVEGDAFFLFDKSKWKEVQRRSFEPDEKNNLAYSFVIYEK